MQQQLDLQTILLVDDNEDDYDAAARGFKAARPTNKLCWCRSGNEALDYLQNADTQLPALVLLDLNMPGIDGRQTLRLMKERSALRSIPVIVMTTSASERDIEQCYELGASTYIQKPVSFEELVRTAKLINDYWFDLALLSHKRKQ